MIQLVLLMHMLGHTRIQLITLITPLITLVSFIFICPFSRHLFVKVISVNFLEMVIFFTQLNTPREYPEYSNRAFFLNTPGGGSLCDMSASYTLLKLL